MASAQFENLLTQLLQATKEKKVQWSETADEKSFRVGLGKGIVRITVDDDLATAVLINDAGKIADSLDQYHGRTPIFEGRPNLHELFDLARASALDVEGLVGGMLENLSQGRFKKLTTETKKKTEDDIPF